MKANYHLFKCVSWVKYMKTDFSTLIFSEWYGWVKGCHDMDTLGEPDGWDFHGNSWSTQLHRQKLGGGIMFGTTKKTFFEY